jgi:hypothetical protein
LNSKNVISSYLGLEALRNLKCRSNLLDFYLLTSEF